jgi:hypothetical protein
MPRPLRVTALASLQVVVLSLGVGMAMAHEPAQPAVAATVPSAPSAREPVVHPVARHTARAVPSPAATRRKAAPRPVRKRVASPRPTATSAPKPAATVATTAPRTSTRTLSAQERLMATVARIPGYRTGDAVWSIRPGLGSWGMAVMGGATVYISPDVPADKLYDVVVHEWSHLLSIKAYNGDVTGAIAAMNRYFGGTDLVGAERAADCMARLLGASWTHYTSCTSTAWRDGARRLISRQRL